MIVSLCDLFGICSGPVALNISHSIEVVVLRSIIACELCF